MDPLVAGLALVVCLLTFILAMRAAALAERALTARATAAAAKSALAKALAARSVAVRAKRAARARAPAEEEDDDDGEEDEEEGPAIPPWLAGIAQGAGIDVPALMAGDPTQAAKAQALLARVTQPATGEAPAAAGGYL